MTQAIKIGLVGTGYWGKNLLRNFDALGALGAFCDTSEKARKAFSEMYPKAKPYKDIADMLASPEIEAVAISTPAATHGELARLALEAGKHVFVEKPLCLDCEEGEALRRLAESKGLILMVGHLLLYHSAFLALKEELSKGTLGKLRYIVSNRLSLGKIRREENALWSFAPHDISMILNLVGSMPVRVSANGGSYLSQNVADTTLSHLTFDDGIQAHIFVSWLNPFKDQKLVVIGSEAMAVFDDVNQGPEKLLLYRHDVRWDGQVPTINKAEAKAIPYAAAEPLRSECQHFLECVKAKARPRSDAQEGLNVLKVLDACQRSLTSGEPVTI